MAGSVGGPRCGVVKGSGFRSMPLGEPRFQIEAGGRAARVSGHVHSGCRSIVMAALLGLSTDSSPKQDPIQSIGARACLRSRCLLQSSFKPSSLSRSLGFALVGAFFFAVTGPPPRRRTCPRPPSILLSVPRRPIGVVRASAAAKGRAPCMGRRLGRRSVEGVALVWPCASTATERTSPRARPMRRAGRAGPTLWSGSPDSPGSRQGEAACFLRRGGMRGRTPEQHRRSHGLG